MKNRMMGSARECLPNSNRNYFDPFKLQCGVDLVVASTGEPENFGRTIGIIRRKLESGKRIVGVGLERPDSKITGLPNHVRLDKEL